MAEMVLESKGADWMSFTNPDGKRVTIVEAQNNRNFKTYWYVLVFNPNTEKSGKTVATRCTYNKAMAIAREHYFG